MRLRPLLCVRDGNSATLFTMTVGIHITSNHYVRPCRERAYQTKPKLGGTSTWRIASARGGAQRQPCNEASFIPPNAQCLIIGSGDFHDNSQALQARLYTHQCVPAYRLSVRQPKC